MLIVLLGGAGQVGAEVALLLRNHPGVEVRPIARSPAASAFLRLKGVPVDHGDVADATEAAGLLEGADVIANFALASGAPRQARSRNAQLISQSYLAAPIGAKMAFFSTISVRGEYDSAGRRRQSFYGALKRSNEKQVAALGRSSYRPTWALRLGHVLGEYQNISYAIRNEIIDGVQSLPFPDRAANVTHAETIADALLTIAEARAGPPGLYDLLDLPQWTWREVYQSEAERLGAKLALSSSPVAGPSRPGLMGAVKGLVGPHLRERALKALALAPASLTNQLKADWGVARARSEIAALQAPPSTTNSALVTPEYTPVRRLAGLAVTRDLIGASRK